MIVALIFLKESNPLIVDENGNRREKKLVKGITFILPENEWHIEQVEMSETTTETKEVKEVKEVKEKRSKPRLTTLMVMCFINEFCVRWVINAFDSRYGIYLTDKFDVKSATFS